MISDDMPTSIHHYQHPELLPGVLALYEPRGILAHLIDAPGTPLRDVLVFTHTETRILIPLLESYPHYAPYHRVLAHYYGQSSDTALEGYRIQVRAALEDGSIEAPLRSMRTSLCCARSKLHAWKLDIGVLKGTGYLLRPLREPKQATREEVNRCVESCV